MRGSKRELKPGVWELRVYCGRDAMTGKDVRISRTFHGGKRQAERAIAALVLEHENRNVGDNKAGVSGQRVTVEQLIEAHLARKEYSPTTLNDYASVVRTHIAPTIGPKSIREVTPALLDKLYAHIREQNDLKPATVRKVHSLLSGAFRTAEKWGWIERNPASRATPPTVRKPELILPTSDGLARALADADERDPEFSMFIRLAAATGARRGELCALRWSVVDLDAATVRIEASAYGKVGGGGGLKGTKNYAKRDVSIDPATVEALQDHRATLEDRATVVGTVLVDDAFVFTDSGDGSIPWLPDRASHAWERTRKRVGMDGVRLHDLRHFQATMLLNAGIAVSNVSKRIGHRDAATTLNVYSQFLEETDRRSADVMGDLLPASRRVTTRSPAPPSTSSVPPQDSPT